MERFSNHISTYRRIFIKFDRIFGQKWLKTGQNTPKIRFYTPEQSEKIENFDFFEIESFSNHVSTCRRIFIKFDRIFSQKWSKTGQNTPKIRF